MLAVVAFMVTPVWPGKVLGPLTREEIYKDV